MKPKWLTIKLPVSQDYEIVKNYLQNYHLNTVCIEARCPNRIECWGKNAITFMILGNICTRRCRFCAVSYGNPKQQIDRSEVSKIAEIVKKLNLSYITITSVTRDDLIDGGAEIFAQTIRAIKNININAKVEVLIPDFLGNETAIETVINAGCDVFAHNVETVENLTPQIRDPKANYQLSLSVIQKAHSYKPELLIKSGFMVGLGEVTQNVLLTIKDLSRVGVSILTIGQYLQAAPHLLPVREYVTPEKFHYYRDFALSSGIKFVFAEPLVRSSYARVNH